jgi:hypothetical protein
MLAVLRRIEADTRALAARANDDDRDYRTGPIARYPVDYYRPAELLTMWRGPGRFFR